MNRSSYWYIRLLTGHEIRPLYVGLLAAAALLLIFSCWAAIVVMLDGNAYFSAASLGFDVMIIAIVSYAVGVTASSLKMTPLDVLALAPALEMDEESLAREAATITDQSSAIHIWTLCWIPTAIVITWWASQIAIDLTALNSESSQQAIVGWPYFRNIIYVFTMSQLAWIDIALAHRLGKLLERHGRINLLDRSNLQQLAKKARRSVLVWIPLLVNSFVYLIVVLPVVLLPALGIRQRYVEEKSLQLKKVRARIADRSAAVIDGSSTSESSNLPELVSWEQRLQQTKVWPYDMTIYLRIFLYAGIGLSSWIGAALVERFMAAFFG